MQFTEKERRYIQIALAEFDLIDRGILPLEEQRTIVASAFDKLEQYTVFTHFTKQEYTIMSVAVYNFLMYSERWPDQDLDILDKLYDELIASASPEPR